MREADLQSPGVLIPAGRVSTSLGSDIFGHLNLSGKLLVPAPHCKQWGSNNTTHEVQRSLQLLPMIMLRGQLNCLDKCL